jgi:hypothetical protein
MSDNDPSSADPLGQIADDRAGKLKLGSRSRGPRRAFIWARSVHRFRVQSPAAE